MALSLAAQETMWLRYLLRELGTPQIPATIMNVDNQAAISMAEHAGYKSRAKLIDLRYHFVRDAVRDGVLKIKYVPTTQQLSEFMTKSLPTPQFIKLVKLGVIVEYPEISN